MKNYINLATFGIFGYVLIEVAIIHMKTFWLIPAVIILILNLIYFNFNKKEKGE